MQIKGMPHTYKAHSFKNTYHGLNLLPLKSLVYMGEKLFVQESQSYATIDDFWKWSRSSSWLQRASQLVLTDEVSTSCCQLCPWNIHIWGGYQTVYSTLSPFWDKQSEILFCTKALHCKLWQIKSRLAQISVHQRQELHPPSKVKSFLPINRLSYACC